MNRKNRIRGTQACLVLIFISMVLMSNQDLQEIALLLIMVAGGYMLRETLDGGIEE